MTALINRRSSRIAAFGIAAGLVLGLGPAFAAPAQVPVAEVSRSAGESAGLSIAQTSLEEKCWWAPVAEQVDPDLETFRFGYSVSVSGDTLVVGNPDDVTGQYQMGSALVFERNAGGADNWGLVATLTDADATPRDDFGRSVAISNDVIVVGNPSADGAFTNAGSATVFARNAGGLDNWGPVAKLTAADAESFERFGYSVSISGETAVVAPLEGSAYVFERNAGGVDHWGQVVKLTPAPQVDDFGRSITISGDTIVVGAPKDDTAGIVDSGSAYVYERNAGGTDNWGLAVKLTVANAEPLSGLGISVATTGDTVVLGATGDVSNESGSAYVFERNAGGSGHWGQVAKLAAADAGIADAFGISSSISEDTVVIGARFASAVYVFQRDQGGAGNWGQVVKLTGGDAAIDNDLGWHVSISGDTFAAGAPGLSDVLRRGASYVFENLVTCPCGDGEVNPGEECDDGNSDAGDGCSATCTLESGACCFSAASECEIVTEMECEANNGRFLGNNSDCAGVQCAPLLASFESVKATHSRAGVLLHWTTLFEIDTVGFRVLRGHSGVRDANLKVLADFIPAAGTGLTGATYDFLDNERQAWSKVEYFIEDIDTKGVVTRHGPFAVELGSPAEQRGRAGVRH